MMLYSLCLTESCATFCNKNIKKDISPTQNINTFISIKDVLSLIYKHGVNVLYYVLFLNLHFSLKKSFICLVLLKQFNTGYWIIS